MRKLPKPHFKSKSYNHLGESWKDEYHGMRLKQSPQVLSYLNAENSHTEKFFRPFKKLSNHLFREMKSTIKETDQSLPIRRGPYDYFNRTKKGKQYPLFCRKLIKGKKEEILLDLNTLAKKHPFLSLGGIAISPDHSMLAYSLDTTGSEAYTLHVINIKTRDAIGPNLIGMSGDFEWLEDNQTLIFSTLDATHRPDKIFLKNISASAKETQLLFHEKDEAYFVNLSKTKDRKFIVIESASKETSETHLFCSQMKNKKCQLVSKRKKGIEYSVEHRNGSLFILTNWKADNFRIMRCSLNKTARLHWKPFIKESSVTSITDIDVFSDFLVLYERQNASGQIRVVSFKRGKPLPLRLPEKIGAVGSGANPDFYAKSFRYSFSSPRIPESTYLYTVETKKRRLLRQKYAGPHFKSSSYRVERLNIPASDGVLVPVTLVYHRDTPMKQAAPMLLYGYGAYGIPMDPSFSSIRLSLLNRGFIYAIAHIRGGGDLGQNWYKAGKYIQKKNSFADFIAVSQALIQKKRTASDRLFIMGGSAGGLLIGAVLNQNPSLYQGALMHVPFVDVTHTMLDDKLPLTVTEYEEWGNPNLKKYFKAIRSYSPYDNIRAQNYPDIFITAGLNDPRVQYWEPAKYTARLRNHKTDNNVLLLKTHMGAGHQGASGRYDALQEYALDYTFILQSLSKHHSR